MVGLRQRAKRRARGSLPGLHLSVTGLILLSLSILAVDIAHLVNAHAELDNAVQAGAIGGALALEDDPLLAEFQALQITEMNRADGRAVSNQSSGVTIIALRTIGSNGYEQVEVMAEMSIEYQLARLLGRLSDTIRSVAAASAAGRLKTACSDRLFPLAVTLDSGPGSGSGGGAARSGSGSGGSGGGAARSGSSCSRGSSTGAAGDSASATATSASSQSISDLPLYVKYSGDSVEFTIGTQSSENAAFTSLTVFPANASFLNQAVDHVLEIARQPDGFVPSVEIGDQIELINGVAGQIDLTRWPRREMILSKSFVLLPVITGGAPFTGSRTVVGFVAVKVTDVLQTSGSRQVLTIRGTLLSVIGCGKAGYIPSTGNTTYDTALRRLSPSVVGLARPSGIL